MHAPTTLVVLWSYLWATVFVATVTLAFGTALVLSELNTAYFRRETTSDWMPLLSVALILGLINGLYLRPFRGIWLSWSLGFLVMVVTGFLSYFVLIDRFSVPLVIWKVVPFFLPGLLVLTNLWLLVQLHRCHGRYSVRLTPQKAIFLVGLFLLILVLFWSRFSILWNMGELATPLASPQLTPQGETIAASPLSVPAHILPEWYFRPFYTVLRLSPSQTTGIVLVFAALLALTIFPWLCRGTAGPFYRSPRLLWMVPLVLCTTLGLGFLAAVPSREEFVRLATSTTVFWFFLFLVGLPWASKRTSSR